MENELNPWFITGFCEGEASFTYNKTGNNIALYFAIKLTKGDENLLCNIQNFFKVGQIYKVKARAPRHNSGHTKAALYYRTTKIADLQVIVDHFEEYPLKGEKRKRYEIWREMFLLKNNFRQCDRDKLILLSQKLSSLNPKNTPWK